MTQTAPRTRVLVVEDNEDVRQVIAVYLGAQGCEVIEAADGLMGLERAAERPDLILLDVLLPKIDGVELLRRLRATPDGKKIPVVVMSAVFQTRDLQAETAELGVSSYLHKPFQLRVLLEQVRSATGTADQAGRLVAPRRPTARRAPGRGRPGLESPAAPTAEPSLREAPDPNPAAGIRSDVVRHLRLPLPSRGTLESTPLPHLLHAVFSEQRTGRLELSAGGLSRAIFFIGGMPVYAESSLPEETLGAHLVRQGVIDQVQNARAVTEMTYTGRRFGEVLLKLGLIGPHDLFRELENHLMEKVIGACSWHGGSYELSDGDSWKDSVVIARMPPGRIILTGVQRHWPASLVRQRTPCQERSRCVILEGPPYDDRHLALTTAEIRILQLARKGLVPSDIEKAVPQPELVRPTLFALFVMEVIGFSKTAAADREVDIGKLVATALESRPPVPPRQEEPARQLLAEYLKLRTADHFTLLGVSRTATPAEITAAFQARQRRYHPDTLVGIDAGLVHEKLEELYLRVHAAYRTLIDPASRRCYVSKLENETATNVPACEPPGGGRDQAGEAVAPEPGRLFQEGQALLHGGDFREAAERFSRAHALNSDPRYLAYRAWAAYLASPSAERAALEGELKRLHAQHDREALYPYLLANFYQREKDRRRAEHFYEKTIDIDRHHIDAARQLRILRMRQRTDEPSGLFDIFRKS
jgi:CheY-like chemotaxis protein/curved DNA-binding protein CbpA